MRRLLRHAKQRQAEEAEKRKRPQSRAESARGGIHAVAKRAWLRLRGAHTCSTSVPQTHADLKSDANAEGPRGIGVARIQLSDFVSEVEFQTKL